jgi:hypothetical protein
MTDTKQSDNKEFATQLSKLSVSFFKSIITLFIIIYKFILLAYQDYIFNRNYKRYLKYIDIYENCNEDDQDV